MMPLEPLFFCPFFGLLIWATEITLKNDRVLQYSLDRLGTCYADEAGLKLRDVPISTPQESLNINVLGSVLPLS